MIKALDKCRTIINSLTEIPGHALQMPGADYRQQATRLVFGELQMARDEMGWLAEHLPPTPALPEVYMPFVDMTRSQLHAVDRKLRERIPALNAAYERHNQIFIESGVNDSMQLFTKFPVTKVDDLKNRKLGSSGS